MNNNKHHSSLKMSSVKTRTTHSRDRCFSTNGKVWHCSFQHKNDNLEYALRLCKTRKFLRFVLGSKALDTKLSILFSLFYNMPIHIALFIKKNGE